MQKDFTLICAKNEIFDHYYLLIVIIGKKDFVILLLMLKLSVYNLCPLRYMQSGCCKPPTDCGYTFMNETLWSPGGGLVGPSPDCARWNNDQQILCYACDSCRAGVLASLKHSWRKVSIINIIVLILLVIFYVIAYAALRNNKRMDNDEPYGETRMTKAHPSALHF